MYLSPLSKAVSASLATFILAVSAAHADDAFSTESQWMFGDWNGKRTELQEKGYDFNFGYGGQFATLLDSSKIDSTHGAEYSDQIVLGTHFDLEKIAGWKDTEAQINVTKRMGDSLSRTSDALDGHQTAAQEVWGRGQTWRLTDFWIKKKFFDQKLDIKVGRMGEGEDFNSFECNFSNLSLCGSQIGDYVGDQWYNWPVSVWAARFKYNWTPEFYTQIGVYEYNPENIDNRGKGFNMSFDGGKGVILPVEAVWQPKFGASKLPGEYRLGYYYSTANVKQVVDESKRGNKQGGWLVANQQFTTHHGDVNRGLSGFMNLAFMDSKTNAVTDMQNIGLRYVGMMDARPKDDLAIGVSRIKVGDNVNRHNDSIGYVDQYGRGYQSDEINVELYYGIHFANWLTVRPNIQYVNHVGGYRHGNDAWVGGIKFNTAF
ncbi:carbohydrate porin [Acinetobacter sp. 187]|uniref:Carbohydrate porin n=1 Tax=Acinetobacter lanii TaxID=2715163 RepID=A0A6G8S1H7_9GAMM|nr:carbohydrate porin [Acinetobacter lanii]NHC03492.1 carbohydrate porin [Acinetobacter lanii]QIO08049.1 carbohydrate porin [Acinetobacter lanii]